MPTYNQSDYDALITSVSAALGCAATSEAVSKALHAHANCGAAITGASDAVNAKRDRVLRASMLVGQVFAAEVQLLNLTAAQIAADLA